MSKKNTYKRIEAYLLQQMSEAERIAFEVELITNEQLAQQLEQQKMEHKVMEALVEKDLLKDIKMWQAEDKDQIAIGIVTSIKVPYYRQPTVIAVIIVFLILTLTLIWFSQKNEGMPSLPIQQEEVDTIRKDEEVIPSLDFEETKAIKKEEDNNEQNEIQQPQIDDSNKRLHNENQPDEDYIAVLDSSIIKDESANPTDQIVVAEQQIPDTQLLKDSINNTDESTIITDQIVIAEQQLSDTQLQDSSVSTKSFSIIKGEILDERTKEPLIGANVLINGTNYGATTDYNGRFNIETDQDFPISILISFIGYDDIEIELTSSNDDLEIKLQENSLIAGVIEVSGQRISEKQKSSPLTIESMDLLAIKETASDNFYDGLGVLKGVDLTTASIGFKIINMRGFNSTSPVRTLQIIDGVDNQSPGLNFSLGNFLGASELDVLKIDLIAGASSAFYGPNAFNGVIAMETKNPFYYQGLSGLVKVGERNLFETAIRYANSIRNKDSLEIFAFKLNFDYLRALDWAADNYNAAYNSKSDENNPGRWDAINIYGDEYFPLNDATKTQLWNDQGLGVYYRTGYEEKDLVDYNIKNYKANAALHFRTHPKLNYESPELIFSSSFGSGTTFYQGDIRFILRNILFFQNRIEYRKRDKWFVRAYATNENGGDSYDPYSTAIKLQEAAKPDEIWGQNYRQIWKTNYEWRLEELGYPQLVWNNNLMRNTFDTEAALIWLNEYNDSLTVWHTQTEAAANLQSVNGTQNFLVPGTPEFDAEFKRITSAKSNEEEGGSKFYDKSALYNLQGEYIFETKAIDHITVGASGRLYRPDSDGTIFYDTAGTTISNWEVGAYLGLDKMFFNKKLRANVTVRIDKNQNFNLLSSPAASLVWNPKPNNFFRFSFSSAIRNPTLTDQYLYLNVGPAILAGNLNGADSLITIESFEDFNALGGTVSDLVYFSIDPIQPEKVKTFELGYRTTLFNKLYIDAGYYYSLYDDFIGYQIGINAEFNEFGFPIYDESFKVYRYAANSANRVTTQGFSIGLNYYLWRYFQFTGNYSWNVLNTKVDDPIVPAFNTPEHKFNIGFSGRDITIPFGKRNIKGFGFNVNYKWIDGFLFEGSPQFTGKIPTYDLLDLQVNYHFRKLHTTLKIGASNVLNKKQFQAYGGPRIGRLAYISLLYEWIEK